MPPSERYSTGNPAGAHSIPSSRARFFAGPSSEPGTARPETSPFTSAAKTATPAAESCSATTWSVRVLPVPVAPAISPWRFIVRSGMRTAGLRDERALVDADPELDRGALGRIGGRDRLAERGCFAGSSPWRAIVPTLVWDPS